VRCRWLYTHIQNIEGLSSLFLADENKGMERLNTEVMGASRRQGMALAIDPESIVTTLRTVKEARDLPIGAIVGDLHGGLTFTDSVAAVLEERSNGGWREIQVATGEIWTVIIVNR
jgi:hypothetical protein